MAKNILPITLMARFFSNSKSSSSQLRSCSSSQVFSRLEKPTHFRRYWFYSSRQQHIQKVWHESEHEMFIISVSILYRYTQIEYSPFHRRRFAFLIFFRLHIQPPSYKMCFMLKIEENSEESNDVKRCEVREAAILSSHAMWNRLRFIWHLMFFVFKLAHKRYYTNGAKSKPYHKETRSHLQFNRQRKEFIAFARVHSCSEIRNKVEMNRPGILHHLTL